MWHSEINPQAAKLLKDWVDEYAVALAKAKGNRRAVRHPGSSLWGQRTLALLWARTGDKKYAAPLSGMLKHNDKYARFKDPVLRGIYSITQHVLVDLAETCYMGEALGQAKQAAKSK